MAKELKVHLYPECTGIPYWAVKAAGDYRVTAWLRATTCGQCKGKILEKLRALPWDKLPDQVITALEMVEDLAMPRPEPSPVQAAVHRRYDSCPKCGKELVGGGALGWDGVKCPDEKSCGYWECT